MSCLKLRQLNFINLAMKFYAAFFLVFFSISFFSCSSKETIEEKKDYVFDADSLDLSDTNLNQLSNDISQNDDNSPSYYLIQIGAFTSEQRAIKFADKSRKLLNEEIIVSFSDKVNLFVVQLGKNFSNREEAEIVRDNLKLFPEFQDAWIISINK